ncbi:MFS transporter [Thermodesulfobacteriota bacterium]
MKIVLILIFWSLWFLNFSSRTVISPLLPIIEDELAINHTLAGSLFLYVSVGFTISVFLSGIISKHIGYKRSIISGYIILVLVLICFRYVETYFYFTIISFFIGLGSGIYLPCAVPLITSVFSRENWGKAIGFHETAASSNLLAVPIIVAFALRYYHWKSFFIIISGACLIIIILFWMLAPNPRPQEGKSIKYISVLIRKDFWIITITWTIMAMATSGIYNIIPLFLVKEKGVELELANFILGFSRVGGVLVMILTGFILDLYGVKKILLTVLLITGMSTAGIALTQATWLLVGMLFIQAAISVGFFPAAILTISKITRLEERSTFTGLTMATASIFGMGIGSVILGALADRWNFRVGIIIVGVLSALCCFLIKGLKE